VSDWWEFVTQSSSWSGQRGITHRAYEHLQLSILATLFAALCALPPAVWLAHIRRGGTVAVSLVNLGRALPSFGIMLLAVPISIRWGYGIGFWPAFVALAFLAIPPIFINAYTGVSEVDRGVVDAARGMGMSPREVLFKVEIPNALPLILTGIRVTTVQVIATASLAAYAGYQCLGSYLTEGIASGDETKLYMGAIGIAVLAIVTDIVFAGIERAATPWLRRRRGPRPTLVITEDRSIVI
jgi:osmoprotectant transport system permease protein